MVSQSQASHITAAQPALERPDQAVAAMHAVLRVAAAEDPSRHSASRLWSQTANRRFSEASKADSYGVASFGNISAQPELTPFEPGRFHMAYHSSSFCMHALEVCLSFGNDT